MKKMVMILNMMAMNRIRGYLGIANGMRSAPQIVLIVERENAKKAAQRYMVTLKRV